MEPRWYHQNGRTGERYKGDRHPEDGYIPEVYEAKERANMDVKGLPAIAFAMA